jgi:hypothetical protein
VVSRYMKFKHSVKESELLVSISLGAALACKRRFSWALSSYAWAQVHKFKDRIDTRTAWQAFGGFDEMNMRLVSVMQVANKLQRRVSIHSISSHLGVPTFAFLFTLIRFFLRFEHPLVYSISL